MDKKAMATHLFAIRTQIDALLLQLGAEDDTPDDAGCPHPVQYRQDLSVMNGPERWSCKACGHLHEEEAA